MEPEEKIIKGAEELFFRFGVRSVTMDDIAKHLGMSKKTIYQCYKDKDEMVFKLMQVQVQQHEEVFGGIQKNSTNVIEEVFEIMKEISSYLSRINPLLMYELQKYYPKAWALFKGLKENFIQKMVESSINGGKEQGIVRQDTDTKILSRLRMEEVEMAFNPAVYPPDKFNHVEVQMALTEHFLYGICTLKGHKLINKYKQIHEEE
ncbi:MAG: TetR/AcrR family transcriptional regulator [Bacteroidota bacterium]|nr:TetR/AcrR family transcriptional regulator [Bacteroidota bacterium]